MSTLPDLSTQAAFFASQAIIEGGQVTGYSAEWWVYHRDTLNAVASAPTHEAALELCDAAIAKMAELRAPEPPPDPLAQEFPATPEEAFAPLPEAEPQAQGSAAALPETTAASNFRHRYSLRANPEAKVGPLVTISFRVPETVKEAFESRIAALVEAGDPGIESLTDAMQDAAVAWLLMEGVA
jgi:hypothetical protein